MTRKTQYTKQHKKHKETKYKNLHQQAIKQCISNVTTSWTYISLV